MTDSKFALTLRATAEELIPGVSLVSKLYEIFGNDTKFNHAVFEDYKEQVDELQEKIILILEQLEKHEVEIEKIKDMQFARVLEDLIISLRDTTSNQKMSFVINATARFWDPRMGNQARRSYWKDIIVKMNEAELSAIHQIGEGRIAILKHNLSLFDPECKVLFFMTSKFSDPDSPILLSRNGHEISLQSNDLVALYEVLVNMSRNSQNPLVKSKSMSIDTKHSKPASTFHLTDRGLAIWHMIKELS